MSFRHVLSRSSLGLLAVLALGCTRTTTPRVEDRPVRADQATDFATLYGRNCAGCHGADGQFGPAPPLNDPLFLAIVPEAVLRQLVAEGRPGTPMPAFSRKKGGTLTDDQVKAVAAGIKARWKAERPKVPAPDYLVAEGRSPGDRGRGQEVFARACAPCHGEEGRGGGEMAGAIHDPAFLALISDQALRRLIITGRRDLEMPDFAGNDGRSADFRALGPTEVADLVALLSGWRGSSNTGRSEDASPR